MIMKIVSSQVPQTSTEQGRICTVTIKITGLCHTGVWTSAVWVCEFIWAGRGSGRRSCKKCLLSRFGVSWPHYCGAGGLFLHSIKECITLDQSKIQTVISSFLRRFSHVVSAYRLLRLYGWLLLAEVGLNRMLVWKRGPVPIEAFKSVLHITGITMKRCLPSSHGSGWRHITMQTVGTFGIGDEHTCQPQETTGFLRPKKTRKIPETAAISTWQHLQPKKQASRQSWERSP